MDNVNILEKQKGIFGILQTLTNKLKAIETTLKYGEEMTLRQWLLTLAIAQFGEEPPTLGEIGELMGSSHQNVKQLAVNLEKKGFLKIERDRQDQRAIRLILTEKSYFYWEDIEGRFKELLFELFDEFSGDELNSLCDCIRKLYDGISKKRHELANINLNLE